MKRKSCSVFKGELHSSLQCYPLYRAPDGSIWATTLSGVPGFIKATDDHHLTVDLKQIYADPVKFAEGDRIGSVGVMLHNRRRNRLNCIVESVQPDSCCLKVLQSFGNCPKYIQGTLFLSDNGAKPANACIPATFCMCICAPLQCKCFLCPSCKDAHEAPAVHRQCL